MRIQKTLIVLCGALLIPVGVFAASFKTGPAAVVQKNDFVAGDLYTAGRMTVISGTVLGDATMAGGNVQVMGRVEGDVLAAGGSVYIAGTVTDDVRVIGGTVLIGGTIGGDVLLAGGDVRILPGTFIGGDVVVAGARVSLQGSIAGSVKVAGGDVVLDGSIGGNAKVTGKNVALGPNALVNGKLTYRSSREIVGNSSAQVRGGVEAQKLPDVDRKFKSAWMVLGGVLFVFKFIVALFTTLMLAYVFKNRAKELLERAHKHVDMNILVGFIVLVAVPVAIVISAFTIIGLFFAALGLLWYLVMLAFSCVFMGLLAGERLWYLATKKSKELHWKSLTLGVAGLAVINIIPVLGWLAAFVFFLWSLGTLATYWYELVWKNR